jgi:hypothetical protein
MSALTDRLSEANLRELARLIRETHARTAARLERERLAREQEEAASPQEARADAGAGTVTRPRAGPPTAAAAPVANEGRPETSPPPRGEVTSTVAHGADDRPGAAR